ncbi:MAG TPA: OB-fold nucleic acid binding domain-containing protein, partial [Mucilaginibacter sp.]|nr:OB-fold nucleic acid binding domain-containing protein [Mucilaginibacter sp.]
MLRTHTCGELNISHLGETVTLCGWVQKSRDLGGTTFIDVRDRYGLTQLVFNTDSDDSLRELSRSLGREFVIRVTGKVLERTSK